MRGDYVVWRRATTRWADDDAYGHMNNAVYYELYDTAINAWINTTADVDPVTAPWLGVVAESGCRYFAELAFPDPLVVGLAVTRLGTSSVTYRLSVFAPDTDAAPVPRTADVGLEDYPHLRRLESLLDQDETVREFEEALESLLDRLEVLQRHSRPR